MTGFSFDDDAAARTRMAEAIGEKPYGVTLHRSFRMFTTDCLLGAALSLLRRQCPEGTTERLAVTFVNTAIAHEHIACVMSAGGAPEACLIWGWLSDRTMTGDAPDNPCRLPQMAVNEGEHLCLLYCAGRPEKVAFLLQSWLADTAAGENTLYLYPGVAGNTGFAAYSVGAFETLVSGFMQASGHDR